ncbi:hypothetical protein SLS60_009528 [Paraconiothyrium brasiliense]|uniref:Uncharacterized protein n=1 Tax=Paraconiothyrium brasiliense TaxID=300254 RepID=A0ABR3QUJ6_9PLEO
MSIPMRQLEGRGDTPFPSSSEFIRDTAIDLVSPIESTPDASTRSESPCARKKRKKQKGQDSNVKRRRVSGIASTQKAPKSGCSDGKGKEKENRISEDIMESIELQTVEATMQKRGDCKEWPIIIG